MAGLLSSGQRRGLLSAGDPASPSIYDMPQVQQLTAPMWDQVLQQPVDYWNWNRAGQKRLADMAWSDPRGLAAEMAPGFVGGLKVEGPGINAWHASPHDFPRFDMSKIGTGEGGAAYGQGLYFAESPNVSGPGGSYDQMFTIRNLGKTADLNPLEYGIWKRIRSGQSDADILQALSQESKWLSPQEAQAEVARVRGKAAKLYQVRINADPNAMLDWDKPLSEQPAAVQDVLASQGVPNMHRLVGKQAYADLAGQHLSKTGQWGPPAEKAASERLRDAGIPGIKYLDQGSRAAGDGTRNYVVFDDRIIDILKKYGWAPFAAGAGGGLLSSEGQQ